MQSDKTARPTWRPDPARAASHASGRSPAPQPAPPAADDPSVHPPARTAIRANHLLLALLVAVPGAITLLGLPYYLLERAERVRHPAHAWLRPSGAIGLGLGITGFALFLFMWLYPLRKRFRWLGFTGAIARWLDIHIAAGLALPVLIAVHAGWRFEGLIGLGYAALILVCLSGVIGRYLYVRIPRSQSGIELTIDDVASERRALITEIAFALHLDPLAVERALAIDARSYARLDPGRTLLRMLADDWARRRAMGALARRWALPRTGASPIDRRRLQHVMRLARRELALSQQVRMLETTRYLFGFWHVAHRPVAITALLAVVIHVVVAVAVGAVRLGWSGR